MKDSDLGIPARPGPMANGPAPQPQIPEQDQKRGPGRPAGTSSAKPNVKEVSTSRLIATKEELEELIAGAGTDQELINKLADAQLLIMDIERILITRRKGNKPA